MPPTAGAVAAPHSLAIHAGQRALRDGGTAIDAALAAAVVLAVVYPHMCSIGGDIQALVAEPGGRVRALGGSGAAARAADASALRATHPAMPVYGVLPITVPGAVAAWGDIHAAGGRLPWSSLFDEALALAGGGVPVAASLGRDLHRLQERLGRDPGMRGVFFHADGRVLATGDILRQPALAASLSAIATQGPRAYGEGEVGARLVAGLRALGSPLSAGDLAAHRSEWLEPVAGRFGEHEVLATPPVSQGYVLVQLLAALERMGNLGQADPLGPAATVLARLCALSAAACDRQLGDPRHAEVDVARWLAPASIDALVAQAQDTAQPLVPPRPTPRPDGDTVAIVAQDAQGRAVTLIQSIFHAFGSGVLEPSTGIVCHNRGAAFTLHDGPALLAGGRRPPTTLTASMLRRDGRVVGALGAMGGRSQPQILMQVLMRLARGEPAADALAAARWVVGAFGPGDETAVLVEGAVDAVTRRFLAASGLAVVEGARRDDRAGHAQIVRSTPSGGIESATDPRADSAAAAG